MVPMAVATSTLADLAPGTALEGVFACTRKERLRTRAGATYLALELRDRSGALPARAFRDADLLAERFERGDLVWVSGRVERFRDELQAELVAIRRAEPGEADPADFLPVAYRDLDELDGFLEHLAREVHDADLRRLLDAFVADGELREAFRRAPCTRGGHHAYLGGLLEHTVAVATLAHELAPLHPRLDSDLLVCAALLHDVGKVREFELGAEIATSEEGRLVGHLVLGDRIVSELAARVRLPAAKAAALSHCVLTHHGPDGVPARRFASAEALALYRLNALDAGVKGALEHGLPA
jgi:3'-5' exoribonuclease